jgi:hypothetical protein
MSAVLKASWGGNLPDSRIDLDALWGTIDPILTAKGWTFDGYFDGAYKIWSLVMEMSHAFRVVPRISAGGVSFVYDRPGRPVRHVFTPMDIVRGSMSIVYNTHTDDTPDNIIWNYLDEDAGFQQREVRCALPDTETKNPVIKSFIGVVKRGQAFGMGIFQVSCNRHRRIQVKFKVEARGRLLLMGDVCAVSHPYFCAVNSGTVMGWDRAMLAVDLGKDTLDLADGKDYFLAMNKPDGRPWGPCRIAGADGGTVTLDAADIKFLCSKGQKDPFDVIGRNRGQWPIWTLQEGKEFAGRLLITSVVPSDNYHFEITAINDSDEVDGYEGLPVPPWHFRGLDAEPVRYLAAPSGFTWSGVTGDRLEARLDLFWNPVAGATLYEVGTSVGDTGSYELVESPRANYHRLVLPSGKTAVRVRARADNGLASEYGKITLDTRDMFGDPLAITVDRFEGGRLDFSWTETAGNLNMVISYQIEIRDPENNSVLRSHTANRLVSVYDPATNKWVSRENEEFTERRFSYPAEMAAADGGLRRRLLLMVKVNGINSSTEPSYATASDPLPELAGIPEIFLEPTAMTFNRADIEGENTGLMILRGGGPNFDIAAALAGGADRARPADALPFVWDGLEPDTEYWFRLGPRDALADLLGQYGDLKYGDALALRTPPLPEPEPGPDPEPEPGQEE